MLSPEFLFVCVCYEGGTSVGDSEESTGDELRQAQPIVALLLREGDHAEGNRAEDLEQ